MPKPIASWNHARDAWETPETEGLFCEHLDVFSETWPTSGMTRNGMAYALPTWAQRTDDSASSSSPLLPTPTTTQRGTDANLDTREGARANLHNEVVSLPPLDDCCGDYPVADERCFDCPVVISNRWGDYAAAIARWEHVIGRTAPDPTETGAKGNPRLSAHFVEWLMGLPAGHVTSEDIGLTRNQQLKALGNGVVPAQSAAATRAFLADMESAR